MAGYPVHYLGTRPPPNRPSVLAYSTRVRKQILREDAAGAIVSKWAYRTADAVSKLEAVGSVSTDEHRVFLGEHHGSIT